MRKKFLAAAMAMVLGAAGITATAQAAGAADSAETARVVHEHSWTEQDRYTERVEANSGYHFVYMVIEYECFSCPATYNDYIQTGYEEHDLQDSFDSHWTCSQCGYREKYGN